MKKALIALGVVAVIAIVAVVAGESFLHRNRAEHIDDIVEHHKYGSNGTQGSPRPPSLIWKVLPKKFPRLLRPLPGHDYEHFGFIYEPGHDRPIGTSIRELPIPLVGLNCATCHTGTIRDAEGAPRRIMLT